MKTKLKDKIDDILKKAKGDSFLIYEKCKVEIKEYEEETGTPFTPDEYMDYVTYITNRIKV